MAVETPEKTLEHYLSLEYPLEIRPMEHSGGGYYARYLDLGAHGDGPTIGAAIQEANVSKELVLEVMLEYGDPIPEPGSYNTHSGRFQVRLPKSLHRALAQEAEREGVSLNMLVVSKLSR